MAVCRLAGESEPSAGGPAQRRLRAWVVSAEQTFKSKWSSGLRVALRISVVWNSPSPEKVIAVAMRRCYSTKPIEEIESELDQKGPEYWKYLLTRALQDKSLDVIEHYCLSLEVEELTKDEVGLLAQKFPYVRFLQLGQEDWLASLNARTLIEMWRDASSKSFAEAVVAALDAKGTSPIFTSLAFGGRKNAG